MGRRAAHGMLKFRCGIIVPPPCLALLRQEHTSLNMEVLSAKSNIKRMNKLKSDLKIMTQKAALTTI